MIQQMHINWHHNLFITLNGHHDGLQHIFKWNAVVEPEVCPGWHWRPLTSGNALTDKTEQVTFDNRKQSLSIQILLVLLRISNDKYSFGAL